ncbi:hypothetical protein MYP_2902 [Sporocytophaga myxococcoides]|uniref:Uncharacterized protein n=1 Tax=Sporocytophaga myxococcoides TaxID=153721 RepID=A0A098LHR2_9BACT|nr:hypothetical protein MYP_2902 [Sporocytophaga myxococcoides]
MVNALYAPSMQPRAAAPLGTRIDMCFIWIYTWKIGKQFLPDFNSEKFKIGILTN